MNDDHPIRIEPNRGRVRVRLGGVVVADTKRALTLFEASYPGVQYIPREDVDMALLARTTHRSHCPYKGDANYFTIKTANRMAENAVWTYETPKSDVAGIASYLAFYPNRVDGIEETPS
jgi:uncharacterized protein (DUF427 family)